VGEAGDCVRRGQADRAPAIDRSTADATAWSRAGGPFLKRLHAAGSYWSGAGLPVGQSDAAGQLGNSGSSCMQPTTCPGRIVNAVSSGAGQRSGSMQQVLDAAVKPTHGGGRTHPTPSAQLQQSNPPRCHKSTPLAVTSTATLHAAEHSAKPCSGPTRSNPPPQPNMQQCAQPVKLPIPGRTPSAGRRLH
jgi:hypothetical protein